MDGAKRIGNADEVKCKEAWRRLVEAPVRQRDAWIDRLKLTFQIEKVSAVPGQNTRCAMGLRRAYIGVHGAEVREAPQTLVIELRECRYEPIAFSRRQCFGILTDAH